MNIASTASRIISSKDEWENDYPVIQTGFSTVDDSITLLREGCLSLVAGSPSMGKTMFAVNLAGNVARNGGKVYYVSLTESSVQIAAKIANIGLLMNDMENILIDDTAYSPLQSRELVAAIRSNCPDVMLIVIDDIQTLGIENIQWLYGAFPNAAVLLMSKVSRDVEERSEHHVGLRDIRGFEQFGQYIAYVFSLFRHDYYYWEEGRDELVELNCLKSRESKNSVFFKKDKYILNDDILGRKLESEG